MTYLLNWPWLQRCLAPWLLKRQSPRRKQLFLTFDDGPTPEVTPSLLALLTETGARATFFMLGQQVERYPSLTAQIHAQGHTLANHSFDHAPFHRISHQQKIQQVARTNAVIEAITHRSCRWFRAPQGRWDLRLLLYLARKGMTAVHWSRDSMDFRKWPPERLVQEFDSHPPVNGDIILFHDDDDRCVEALKTLIPRWQAQGFELCALESRS
ncbi:putative 30.6 kDa protein in fumA 3'region [Saliniradius amylolyticus]|uniref:Putative 30.6 kDa protein in fumA 3'region n=1 Tax=Saliniradius amylolyticus TaxID=2183582 RepID=A0A2S2E331_9ALTE|nr:polysaccharide deacetylase family protein [Saliniradius amylolyticus]AWL11660.1 putative 30.6 kDa protein in fumA 3'region [Saliniradius amylolyticus]